MEFPLKPDFFPAVRLGPAEAEAYASRAEASARALLKVLRGPHWRQVAAPNRGVALAKMLRIDVDESTTDDAGGSNNNRSGGGSKASACLLVCGTSLAAGSVREVVDAIGASDADEYRRAMAFVHEARFLDAVTLCSVNSGDCKPKKLPTATTTIKWAAFRDDGRRSSASGAASSSQSSSAASASTTAATASSSTVEGTDYCFLEHVGVLTDDEEGGNIPTGVDSDSPGRLLRKKTHQNPSKLSREVGFVVQESIERAREVPSLAGFGLARDELRRAGTLVLPTCCPGIVQVSSVLQLRLASSSSPSGRRQSVVERQLLRRVASVSRVELLLERRRLARMQFVPRSAWVADELRRSCAVCVKPFALRRRKHHCRACGEVVCASCAPQRETCVDSDSGGSARVCTKCLIQARRGLTIGAGSCDAVPPSVADEVVVSAPLPPSASPLVRSLTAGSEDNKRSEARGTAAVERRPYVRASSASSDGSNFSIALSESVMSIRECGWVADVEPELKANHGVSRVPSRFAGVRSDGGHNAERFVPCPNLASSPSSSSSSSVSLSELDAFEDLIAVNAPSSSSSQSPVLVRNHRQAAHKHHVGDDYAVNTDNQQSHGHQESIDNVLERIRRMKAGLSVLSTAYQTDQGDDRGNASTPAAVSPLNSASNTTGRQPMEAPVPTGTSVDVDYISTSDDFNLLSPESLNLPREQSIHQQDAGEKSRRSNFSCFTVSIVLDADDYDQDDDVSDDDDDDDVSDYYYDDDLNEDVDYHGGRERSNSQAELMALRRQVEGLHRSLAIATTKLQTFEAIAMAGGQPYSSDNQRQRGRRRRSSHQSDSSGRRARRAERELDPAVSHTYDALVAELHELMGLPTPAPRPVLAHRE